MAIPRPLNVVVVRDNTWRRLRPRLKPAGLEWATFQIMRRTRAILSGRAGIDPKIVAESVPVEFCIFGEPSIIGDTVYKRLQYPK